MSQPTSKPVMGPSPDCVERPTATSMPRALEEDRRGRERMMRSGRKPGRGWGAPVGIGPLDAERAGSATGVRHVLARVLATVLASGVLVAQGCRSDPSQPVTLVFVGDMMLGRGV